MDKNENFKMQLIKFKSFENALPQHRNGQIKSLNELFLGIDVNSKILDVGCGDGVGLNWFKNNGYRNVEGIDGNPNKLEEANKIGFITYEGDIHDLSKIVNDKYDIIYCSHVLEHMFHPDVVIEEFKKILNINGVIIIILPYPDYGDNDAHCGKNYLMTNKKSKNEIDIINVFKKHELCLLFKKLSTIRENEIFLKFKIC